MTQPPSGSPSAGRPDRHDLERWVATVGRELDLDLAGVDIDRVLDLARDAAHGVARPAAPLTTYLAGYVVGAAGGDEATLDRVLAQLTRLAEEWAT